jgi:CRP/FNR family transcriptional regulator
MQRGNAQPLVLIKRRRKIHVVREAESAHQDKANQACGFLSRLSPATLEDLKSIELPLSFPAGNALYSEQQAAQGIFVIHTGEVKLSMNSIDGKRLILRIAKAGEVLGLTSALTGEPSEVTAETLYPAMIGVIRRFDFLGFLMRHPNVYQVLVSELSRDLTVACERLRTVGLAPSSPGRVARLLLDWSENGQETEEGTRLRFALTHAEIGEFVGVSRETVTRTLMLLKNRRLVTSRGSILTIPSRAALENYARC